MICVIVTNFHLVLLQCYMRALFDYNPTEDTLIPCKEIGLAFKHGDILQVSFKQFCMIVIVIIYIKY